MIYDVIFQVFQRDNSSHNSIVKSFINLEDAKAAAESLAVAYSTEVLISLRLGSYQPKAIWNPQERINSEEKL